MLLIVITRKNMAEHAYEQYCDQQQYEELQQVFAGKYVAFEGLDGSGKSTAIKWLAETLFPNNLVVREPGTTDFGEVVRAILLEGGFQLRVLSQLFMFMASRNESLHKVVIPARQEGKVVLSDRSYWSSFAYQGAHYGVSLPWFQSLVREVHGRNDFDLIVHFAVGVPLALERAGKVSPEGDNYETQDLAFFQITHNGYVDLVNDFVRNSECIYSEENFELYINKLTGQHLVVLNATVDLETVRRNLVKALYCYARSVQVLEQARAQAQAAAREQQATQEAAQA